MAEATTKAEYYVGVDLGGTKILTGVFDEKLTCLGRSKMSTKSERGADGVIERIARCIRDAVDECDLDIKQIKGVICGVHCNGNSSRFGQLACEAPENFRIDKSACVAMLLKGKQVSNLRRFSCLATKFTILHAKNANGEISSRNVKVGSGVSRIGNVSFASCGRTCADAFRHGVEILHLWVGR